MHFFTQRGWDGTSANDIKCSATTAGSLRYEDNQVLEYLYTGTAAFEDNEAGVADRLGMEVSSELAAARRHAKFGMIWFEK